MAARCAAARGAALASCCDAFCLYHRTRRFLRAARGDGDIVPLGGAARQNVVVYIGGDAWLAA
jgi:hypothetical protein